MPRLRLRYSPTPENAPRFASDIVTAAANVSGVNLDYSVESLKLVDTIVQGLRDDGSTVEQVAETLFGFGCYVGEVFVRHAGGRWQNAARTADAEFIGFPLAVGLGNGFLCNPIGKVFKRLRDGEEHDLPYFYQVFTAQR